MIRIGTRSKDFANCTNAWVRCVEIRDNSVVIQVEGAPERQELFLKVK